MAHVQIDHYHDFCYNKLVFLKGYYVLERKARHKMAVDTTELRRNADWYYANLDSLLPKYNGKYIGISDCSVVGVFNTFSGGVDEMIGSGHRPGSFIVHQCVDLEEEKKRFFSRMPRMVFREVSK